MTSSPFPHASLLSSCEPSQRIDLRCVSYGDRSSVLDDLLRGMEQCGCWLQTRRVPSDSLVELSFGAMLGAMDEIYGGLVAVGIEMPRDSHQALTWLCTLRRYRKETVVATRTVSIRMEIRFLSDVAEEMGFVAAGMA